MKYSMLFMLKAALFVTLFTSIPGETFAIHNAGSIFNQPVKQKNAQPAKKKNAQPAKQNTVQPTKKKNAEPAKQKNRQKRKPANNNLPGTISIPSIFGKLRTNDIIISLK